MFVSGTITDRSGRTLSGQTPCAFAISVAHVQPLCIGLNCALGAKEMAPYLTELSNYVPTFVLCYPNAGLPKALKGYADATPELMAAKMGRFAEAGLLNIVGGCCGTTPAHIAAIKKACEVHPPRRIPAPSALAESTLELSGLEPLLVNAGTNFVNIGERCNVLGSRRFLRLIKSGQFEDALQVAHKQVRGSGCRLPV